MKTTRHLLFFLASSGILAGQTNFSATHDSYVRPTDGTNYGSAGELVVRDNNGTNAFTRISFLQFDASSFGSSTGLAQLSLTSTLTNATTEAITVHAIANNSWDESTISGTNYPSLGSALTTFSLDGSGTEQAVTLDLTSYVNQALAADGIISIALEGGDSGGYSGFHSSEASNALNAPTLTLSAVPEPSTYALLIGAASLLFVCARRRKRSH